MSKSYFPTDRAGRTAWYDNFAEEFRKVGKDLGFSETEVTNAVSDAEYAVHILNTLGPDIDADPGHAGNAVLITWIFPVVAVRRLPSGQESTLGAKRASKESKPIQSPILTSQSSCESKRKNWTPRNIKLGSGALARLEILLPFRFARSAAACRE
jgi:hypothetical protein